ncbi:MAG: AarF/UbiB family protein, partial [Caldilineaceae bacterium]
MRLLTNLLRLAVNAFAISVTAWLVPGIEVIDDRLWVYAVLALGFALVNTLVRPLVLFFTARFVIATMGIFILVVNAFLLWIMGILFPTALVVNGLFPALLGGIVISLIATFLEAILGLTVPIGPTGKSSTTTYGGLERLGGRRNRLLENVRIQQVYQTFWRFGLDIAMEGSALGDFRQAMQRRVYRMTGEKQAITVPGKVRLMLQELGPMYVKLGQIASSQVQALPQEWLVELGKLQNTVPPFSPEVSRQLIEKELNAKVEERFATFDPEPFAAASTAQVHRATLFDGSAVVVKVQRPNIEPQVKADLGIMQDVAETMERYFGWAKDYAATAVVTEYADHVLTELNYQNEAFNAIQLQHNMTVYSQVHVPDVHLNLSTSRVLTMEFVEGVKITKVAEIDAAGLDRKALAETFVRAIIKQLLFDGFFHGDPHPGNILVNLTTGQLQFLDMGMMGTLNSDQRMNLADLILTLYQGDSGDLGRVLLNLSTPFKAVDETAFKTALDQEVKRQTIVSQRTEESSGISGLLGAVLSVMHQHGLRMHQELTLAIKTILQAEEAAHALDPDVDLVAIAISESGQLFAAQVNVDTIVDTVKKEGMRSLKEVVRHLPTLQQATAKWLQQYESGRLTVHLDTSQLASQVGEFSTSMRSVALSIVLLGMLLGSAMAAQADASVWGFIPLAGTLL